MKSVSFFNSKKFLSKIRKVVEKDKLQVYVLNQMMDYELLKQVCPSLHSTTKDSEQYIRGTVS